MSRKGQDSELRAAKSVRWGQESEDCEMEEEGFLPSSKG